MCTHGCDCVSVCGDRSGQFGVPFFSEIPSVKIWSLKVSETRPCVSGTLKFQDSGILWPMALTCMGDHSRLPVAGPGSGVWSGVHMWYPRSSSQQPCCRVPVTLILQTGSLRAPARLSRGLVSARMPTQVLASSACALKHLTVESKVIIVNVLGL